MSTTSTDPGFRWAVAVLTLGTAAIHLSLNFPDPVFIIERPRLPGPAGGAPLPADGPPPRHHTLGARRVRRAHDLPVDPLRSPQPHRLHRQSHRGSPHRRPSPVDPAPAVGREGERSGKPCLFCPKRAWTDGTDTGGSDAKSDDLQSLRTDNRDRRIAPAARRSRETAWQVPRIPLYRMRRARAPAQEGYDGTVGAFRASREEPRLSVRQLATTGRQRPFHLMETPTTLVILSMRGTRDVRGSSLRPPSAR